MLNIAIVDDEPIFINMLIDKIDDSCKILNINYSVDKYSNGFDLLDNYKKYHIVFLDIEMPDIDGIAIAQKINELKSDFEFPYLIFITSHYNLVFDALKSFPYTFIRKDAVNDDLFRCLNRIKNSIKFSLQTIVIRSERKDIVIKVSDIIFLEKQKNYVIYYTADTHYKIRSDINKELEKLSAFGFVRPHIGYVVNKRAITCITSDCISLINGKDIPLNKKRRDEIKHIYYKWLCDKNN